MAIISGSRVRVTDGNYRGVQGTVIGTETDAGTVHIGAVVGPPVTGQRTAVIVCRAVVTSKVLNEGVDVPDANVAVVEG